MISVQSHPLPLNGNKNLFLVAFFVFFIFFGCNASKKTNQGNVIIEPIVIEKESQETIIVEEKLKEEKPKEDKKPKEEAESSKKDTVKVPIVIPEIKDKILDIVLILPFDCLKYPLEVEDIKLLEFSNNTKLSLDFYSGILYAIEDLKKGNNTINIKVIDNSSNGVSIEKKLTAIKGDIDVIVGPVYNKELREVSEYAKINKIPMISPLSSSTTVTSQNPYYYSANASSEMHIQKILDYINNYDEKSIVAKENHVHVNYQTPDVPRKINIIHFSDPTELNTVKTIKNLSKNPSNIYEIPIGLNTSAQTLKSHLDSTKHNYIILPLYSESNILQATNILSQLSNNFSMTVFGMSTWRKFDKINYQYLNMINVLITSSSFIDKDLYRVRNFIYSYKEKYKQTPGEYVFQGYDLIQYLAKTFREGQLFKLKYDNQSSLSSLHTQFDFIPRFNSDNKIDYYDNKFVHILQFENYNFKRIK